MAENKNYYISTQEGGSVQISEDVIAFIAAQATAEVEGVYGLSAKNGKDLAVLSGKRNLGKGVKLLILDGKMNIHILIVALYGYSVVEIARNIQDKVMSAVEAMTGGTVESVNVEICGITLPKEPKK